MSTKSLGTLTLDLIAKTGGFVAGMSDAERSADKWRAKVEKNAKAVGTAIGIGVAAGVSALTALTIQTVRAADEIVRLSALSGTSNTQFQKYAAGAKLVGIQQEKLADIFKDVNDKLGDFMQTGAGPMADFFENIAPKVGVTAEQFKKLSGPDALGLYVSSLEKAGVSQNEMTFYMEAIASDATLLLPLLKNSSQGFSELGDAAEQAGAIMDDAMLQKSQELSVAMEMLKLNMTGVKNAIAGPLIESLANMATGLEGVATEGDVAAFIGDELSGSFEWIAKTGVGAAASISLVVKSLSGLVKVAGAAGGGFTWSDLLQSPLMIAKKAAGNADEIRKVAQDALAGLDDTAQKYASILKALEGGDNKEEVESRIKRIAEYRLEVSKALEGAGMGGGNAKEREATKKLADEIDKLAKSYQANIDALIKTDRQMLEYDLTLKKASETDRERVLAIYDQARAYESAANAVELYLDAEEGRSKARSEIKTNIDALNRERNAILQSRDAHAAVIREIHIEAQMRNVLASGIEMNDAEYRKLLETQYDLQKGVQDLTKEHEGAAAIISRGYERMRDAVGEYFQKLIVDGKASFSDLLDMFKRMIAEMVATAAANKIFVSVGLGGNSTGGGGGGFNIASLGSWVNAGKSLWNGFSGLANGQGFSGFAGMFGGHAANSAMIPSHMLTRAASQQAASLTKFTNTAGPWLAAIGGAIQGWQTGNKLNAVTGAAGAVGGMKAGAAVGTYIFPGIGTAIGAALGAVLGGTLGSKVFGGEYETTRGGIQLGFGADGFDPMAWERQTKAGGLFSSSKRRYRFDALGEELDAMVNGAYDATIDSVKSLYESIGIAVTESSLEGVKIATLQIGTSGKSEQAAEEIEAQITQWFNDLQEALVSSVNNTLTFAELSDLVNSLSSVNAVFGMLNMSLNEVSLEGAKSAQVLIAAAGGIEALVAATDFYYQNFYSEQERLQKSTELLTDALSDLGLELPSTREEFRALVEAARDAGAGSEELLASLLALAPAVDGVIRGNDAMAESAKQLAQAQAQSIAQLTSQSKALEIQLLRVQGLVAEADAMQYGIDTEGMTEAEQAIFDYNLALQQQIDSLLDAQEKERAAIALREQLADQAAKEREQKEASQAAAQMAAVEAMLAQQQRIADERARLEVQLLQAQGNTAELRRRELAQLDASNRDILKQIYAIEDRAEAERAQAEAMDEARRAAENLRNEWGRLFDTMLEEAKRIRQQLVGTDGSQSFAAAQSRFSILTAQARAGDQNAAGSLPDAARTLLEIAETQAKSYTDFARIAGLTANSLEETARSMPTVEEESQLVKNSTETNNKLEMLRIANEHGIFSINRLLRIFEDVTQGGTSLMVTEVAP